MSPADRVALALGLGALGYASPALAEPVEVLRLEYQCGSTWHPMRIGALDCTGVFPIFPLNCGHCEVPEGFLELGHLPWRQAQKDVLWAFVVRDPGGERRIPLAGEGCDAVGEQPFIDFLGDPAVQADSCRDGYLAWTYYYWYILDALHGRQFENTILHLSLVPTLGLPPAPAPKTP